MFAEESELKDSSPKNANSVINYSPSCRSKPVRPSSEHKLRYFWWNPRAFWPSIDSNVTEMFPGTETLMSTDVTWTIFPSPYFRFCALTVVVPLLSMEGQKALGFHQKHLNLCSKDERRSYGFGTTWGWVINNYPFNWFVSSSLLEYKSILA